MEPRIEVRFGLVMYGGVSLAIYIHGVSREFFEASRDTGIYKVIGALTDSRVGVDIISGTSAGGINGIFLAYALTQNKEFGEMANLWRNLGDISKLLRPVPQKDETCESLLAGESFYHDSLLTAFRTMGEANPPVANPPRELDLFVTGTDIHGNLYTTTDDSGHVIDVKDHRTVFVLKHRSGRKEPFNAQDAETYKDPNTAYQALSKLARITSCFPAAFAPVPVVCNGKPTPNAMHDTEDEYLQEWGAVEQTSYFQDGGVLDNKPFSYTIQEIFGRDADREVERVLCYVEPDPEKFTPNSEPEKRPTFLEAVFSGTYGTTSYESIADDLESIRQRNSQIEKYKRLSEKLRDILELPKGADEIVPTGAGASSILCLRARLGLLMDRVVIGVLKKQGRHRSLLEEKEKENVKKLVITFDDFAGQEQDILRSFDVYYRMRRLYATVYRLYDDLYPNTSFDANTTLRNKPNREREKYLESAREVWRQLNRQIKLLEIVRYWMEWVVDNMEFDLSQTLDSGEVWQVVAAALEHLLDANSWPAECNLEGELDQPQLEMIHSVLRARAYPLKGPPIEKRIPNFRGLLSVIDNLGKKTTSAEGAPAVAKAAFDNFVELDAKLFPMEWMAGIEQKDIIRTHRISPADAHNGFSELDLQSKMAGDQLAHFSGFFKRSWRSNDILWGRLDGLCQITEILLATNRLKRVLSQPHRRENFAEHWKALELDKLFPHSSETAIEEIQSWARALQSTDPAIFESAVSGPRYDAAIKLLIEMGQLEILCKELPTVVSDAAVQEASWNRTRVMTPPEQSIVESVMKAMASTALDDRKKTATAFSAEMAKLFGDDARAIQDCYSNWSINYQKYPANDPELIDAIRKGIDTARGNGDFSRLEWIAAQGPVDKLITTVSCEYRAKAEFEALALTPAKAPPKDTPLGQFFRLQYQVGSEGIMGDIPKIVLFEIACQAILVTLSCLTGSLSPGWRARIEENWLYRWVLRLPPQVGLAISKNVREDPAVAIALKSGATAVMIAALVVGIYYWNPLVFGSDEKGLHFTAKWFLLLFVVPVFGIYTLWLRRVARIMSWVPVAAGVVFGGFFLYHALVTPHTYNGFRKPGIALEFVKTAEDLPVFRTLTPDALAQAKDALETDSSIVIPAYTFMFTMFAVWVVTVARRRTRLLALAVFVLAFMSAYADHSENRNILRLLEMMTPERAFAVFMAAETKWLSIFMAIGILGAVVFTQKAKLSQALRLSTGAVAMMTAVAGIVLSLLRSSWVEIPLILMGLSLILLGRCMHNTVSE